MKTAFDKLRERREELGRSPSDLAAAIGVPVAWYYDLEGPDELETNLDLDKILKLASELKIRPASLFCERVVLDVISPTTLADSIHKFIDKDGKSLDQFEELAGWELRDFLSEPETDIKSWSIDKLKAVCSVLNCDWVPVVNALSPPAIHG